MEERIEMVGGIMKNVGWQGASRLFLICGLLFASHACASTRPPALSSNAAQENQTAKPDKDKPVSEPEKALTPEEKSALLDRKLKESLQEFDGVLLREKDLLKEKRPEGAQSSNAGGAQQNKKPSGRGDGGNGDGTQSGQGQNGQGQNSRGDQGAQNTSASNNQGSAGQQNQGQGDENGPAGTESGSEAGRAGAKSAQGNNAGGRGAIPPDIPDGRDDDIVARQLREAAMKEQDPALKEKLWEEYRKYKGIGTKKNNQP